MSGRAFQEKFDKALVYKKEGKLADALKLYEELYGLLIKEAGDYAKSLEKSGSAEDGTVSNMPLFIQNTEEYLKSDNVACILLNNICMILAKAGNKKAAEKYFRKSLKYMPGGLDSARQDI